MERINIITVLLLENFPEKPKIFAFISVVPESGGHLSNLLYTVIPCVVFGLIVAIVIIAVCWKRHKQGPDAIKKGTRMTVTVLLPEVSTNSYFVMFREGVKEGKVLV